MTAFVTPRVGAKVVAGLGVSGRGTTTGQVVSGGSGLSTLTPNALYYLNSPSPAGVPAAVAARPEFKVKVIEPYQDPSSSSGTFSQAQVTSMKSSTECLLAYFSIGEAEDFRWYWAGLSPAAKGPVNPQWPGDFEVAYWTTEWRTLCASELQKYLDLGYHGIYFDVVDEYQLPWAISHVPGGTAIAAENAMLDLITYLANYGRTQVPSWKVWVNNAEELYSAHPSYVALVDGCYKENLFYQDNGNVQPTGETNDGLAFLQPMLTAHKPVCCIEYVIGASSQAAKITDVQTKAAAHGLGHYCGFLDLDRISLEGVN